MPGSYCGGRQRELEDRDPAAIEGLFVNSYRSLTIDEDERAAGFKLLARQVWNAYMEKIPKERIAPIASALGDIDREMLNRRSIPSGVSRKSAMCCAPNLAWKRRRPFPPRTNAPPEILSTTNLKVTAKQLNV